MHMTSRHARFDDVDVVIRLIPNLSSGSITNILGNVLVNQKRLTRRCPARVPCFFVALRAQPPPVGTRSLHVHEAGPWLPCLLAIRRQLSPVQRYELAPPRGVLWILPAGRQFTVTNFLFRVAYFIFCKLLTR